tara:strand:- start:42 stop:221 length:180 start_codon:yes stop_codon:yes gene_type:complete
MPKKKLTKAQVKRKIKTAHSNIATLNIDKLTHPDSNVKMSEKILTEIRNKLIRALIAIK